MSTTLEAVRPIELSEIREARKRIEKTIVRTPLVCLELGAGFPDIRLKLENLQPINAYKLRGAANAVAMLPESERRRGVWTISAGNAGQGVAYAAKQAGVPCTVVVIETAPASKMERMRSLDAKLIPVRYDVAWKALEDRSFTGVEGTFVHPFDDHNFIAGHGTLGLEILEDAPDTAAIIASIGGGGLITGVASAIKASVHGLESVVCRWRWWPKHVPSDVGANEIASGRLHRRQPGRNERRDAPHGGKGANYFRRRGRTAGRGGADRKSRQRPDCGHCLRREYRS